MSLHGKYFTKLFEEITVSEGLEEYDFCRVCGKKLDPEAAAWARKKFEQGTCSPRCWEKWLISHIGCCDKARLSKKPCVCAYRTDCPVHGDRHIGSHD